MNKPALSINRFIDGYRGHLWRKSQLNGAWKYRYFILEKKKLRCYEDDSCLKLVSELTVFNDTELFDLPGTSDNRANLFYFAASATDDVYYLSADHPSDKAHWLEAISDAKHNGFKLIEQPRLGIEPFYPSIDLCVTFGDNSIFASNDNKLQPHAIELAPTIIMRFANPTSIYSLIMIDLDSVRANAEERTEYLMWGIVNIEGTDVSSGLELAPYESPAPEYGSGMHRYMFLLFDQSSDFTPDQFDELDDIFLHRDQFRHLDWMKQFHLAAPAAINGFYAGWEEHCDELHERMGYTPAVVYFSPKMEATAETGRTEKARVDLFRDLVLGDIFPHNEVDSENPPLHGTIAMTIEYDNDYVVEDGQTIPASQVKSEPAVAFYPHPIGVDANGQQECGLYTLLLVDPDAPSRINHDLREFIYWVVLNIADADVSKGDVALPYMGPAPSYASGLHRNVFCLYKQKRAFSAQEVEATKKFYLGRKGITSFDWVRKQHDVLFKVPVGVEAFLSEWDLSVDDAHAAMAYMPPEQYRSPAQRRSMLIAGAGTPRPGFTAMTPRTAEQDVIGSRLRKIHEAEERFNTKVIETSRVNHELSHSNTNSGANSPMGGAHEEMFGVDMDDEQSVEAKPAPKKVVQRNPVTFSGTSKTLSPRDAANQPLSLSLGEDTSVAASKAALLDSSNEQKNDVITSSREVSSSNATSVAKRAEHHTDQTQKANTVNKARRETSDGHFSEETTESQHEQHFEERTERSEVSEHSELRQESHSTTTTPRKSIKAGAQLAIDSSAELSNSRDVHESSSRNQQSQLKQLQLEADQRQQEEAQQQEQARREQKIQMQRQQQEVLERQAQEQQRQQRLQQEQQEREFEERNAARQRREQEERDLYERNAWELQNQQSQQPQQRSGGSPRHHQQQQEQERAAWEQQQQREKQEQERAAWEQQQQREKQERASASSSRRQREQQEQLEREAQEQKMRQNSSRQQQQAPRPSSSRTSSRQEEHKDASSPPKGRPKDFFSALPDSEYSDTDTGSVISGVPQSDRYQQEQQQKQKPATAPASSTMRSQGHAAVDMEEQSVASDASSQQASVARSSVDLRQQAAAKRAESSGGSGGRYKQLLEGLATVKSTSQLCDLFQVSTSSIFAGEKMKKKMNNDFMFKDSYIWVIPRTRTLHWSKTKGDAGDSKYLLLDTVTGVDPTAPPKGEFKGIVKRVRVSGPNLLITIESGDFLELKLSADGAPPAQKRANDWAVVIKAFTQG